MIRRMGVGDAEAYQRIRRQALEQVPQFVGPQAAWEAGCSLGELRARLERYEEEGLYAFGYFREGMCLGVAGMRRELGERYRHKVFFWGLYVTPEGRGAGVGRALMDHRIATARRMPGVRICSLQMTTTNEPARRLHRAAGFVSCGVEREAMCVGGVYYDFELMQLRLVEN